MGTTRFSLGVSQPKQKAVQPPFSAEVGNEWSQTTVPPIRLNGIFCFHIINDMPINHFKTKKVKYFLSIALLFPKELETSVI